MTVLTKGLIILGIIAGLFGSGTYLYNKYRSEKQARIVAELALVGQKQINDSTAARLTTLGIDRVALEAALRAEKQLSGTLIAALKIKVAARDTTIIHDTIVTQISSDSTRTAEFSDSTFAGRISGRVTAPPCCAPLGITYRLDRPEFSPTVAFVQIGTHVAATVTWQGERVEIDAPFALPQTPVKRLGTATIIDYRPLDSRIVVGQQAILRAFWGLAISGQAEYVVGEQGYLRIGLRKEW